MNAIEVTQLNKSYGNNHVVRDCSFAVKKGNIFALLGANGAGKTTTLECIEKIKHYDSGKIEVRGCVGVQLQTSSLPESMKGKEALKLFAKWNKCQIDDQVIQDLKVKELLNKQYKDMSTGQKRRLHLALALLHDPKIIFLDEPTAGLDVEGRLALHTQMKLLKEKGKTIILASHDMAEVEALCDEIAILKKGQIVLLGTPLELAERQNKEATVHVVTQSGQHTIESNHLVDDLIQYLTECKQNKLHIKDIYMEKASLEERFVSIVEGDE